MADALAWGILGAGRIAGAFAKGVGASRTGRLVAVGSRSQEKADAFGQEHSVERRHGSYESLLADEQVKAVYVATPHPMHAEWAIKAAEAGKHVLCEKPIAMNHAQAADIVRAARDNDVFLMEAFMYRCHPQTARLLELVRDKEIGEVRLIRASFGFSARFDPDSRLFNKAMGGGGILDVGCYCTSMCRLIAGAAVGGDFAEPTALKGLGHIGRTGVDEWAVACLSFPGDILAEVSTGISLGQDNAVQVFGTDGSILVPSPWIPSREGGATRIIVERAGRDEPTEVLVETSEFLYGIEADTVAANIERRQAPAPAMSWDDSLGNMKALDLWRASFGLVYEADAT